MAEKFGQRPSSILAGSWSDFVIDLNVMIVGIEETNQRQDTKKKPAPTPGPKAQKPKAGKARGGKTKGGKAQQFAHPASLARFQGKGLNIKTMAIPEDGIW